MWKANIDKVAAEEKDIVVIVTFFDQGFSGKFQKDFHFSSGSKEDVYSVIRNQLDGLNAAKNLPADIVLGPFDASISAPTPQQLAKEAFLKELRILRSYFDAIALNVLDINDPAYLIQITKVKQLFIAEYLDLF